MPDRVAGRALGRRAEDALHFARHRARSGNPHFPLNAWEALTADDWRELGPANRQRIRAGVATLLRRVPEGECRDRAAALRAKLRPAVLEADPIG